MRVLPRIRLPIQRTTLLFALAAITSAVLLWALTAPFVWVCLLWLVILMVGARSTAATRPRLIFFYLAGLVFTIGCLEAYFQVSARSSPRPRRIAVDESGERIKAKLPHNSLGYAARPDHAGRVVATLRGERLWEADYTIGADGLRIPPPVGPGGAQECVLFFGGSFTFGTGVNDDETLPYRTGIASGGRYAVYNFAYGGYGPHQMLALIEDGTVDSTIRDCVPRVVIYQGTTNHAGRAAGRASWDQHGPRYVLDAEEGVVRNLNFDSVDRWRRELRTVARKSFAVRALYFDRVREDDIDLMVAILDKSRMQLQQRYSDSEFQVIFWDFGYREETIALIRKLRDRGFSVHPISEILPGSIYDHVLNPHVDDHPTADAHRQVADYVVREILGQPVEN